MLSFTFVDCTRFALVCLRLRFVRVLTVGAAYDLRYTFTLYVGLLLRYVVPFYVILRLLTLRCLVLRCLRCLLRLRLPLFQLFTHVTFAFAFVCSPAFILPYVYVRYFYVAHVYVCLRLRYATLRCVYVTRFALLILRPVCSLRLVRLIALRTLPVAVAARLLYTFQIADLVDHVVYRYAFTFVALRYRFPFAFTFVPVYVYVTLRLRLPLIAALPFTALLHVFTLRCVRFCLRLRYTLRLR